MTPFHLNVTLSVQSNILNSLFCFIPVGFTVYATPLIFTYVYFFTSNLHLLHFALLVRCQTAFAVLTLISLIPLHHPGCSLIFILVVLIFSSNSLQESSWAYFPKCLTASLNVRYSSTVAWFLGYLLIMILYVILGGTFLVRVIFYTVISAYIVNYFAF